jgi:hypothetical protein
MLLHDFLPNWMIFFRLSSTWLSDLYVTKNCISVDAQQLKTEILFFQSLNHVDFDLKPQFLIKSGYYIVPSPFTPLEKSVANFVHLRIGLENVTGVGYVVSFYHCKVSEKQSIQMFTVFKMEPNPEQDTENVLPLH